MAAKTGWRWQGGGDPAEDFREHQDAEVRQPLPLPDLPAVAPFDYDLLPESFKPWVRDIAERLQCPPDFVAVAAMVRIPRHPASDSTRRRPRIPRDPGRLFQ
jgi:hypothetical protein